MKRREPLAFSLVAVLLAGVSVLAVTITRPGQAEDRKPDPEHGRLVFYENCAACHNRLKKVGPSLVDDTAYFVRAGVPPPAMGTLLRKPVRQRPEGSRMPAFTPSEISDADLDDLGLYLAGFTPVPKPPPAMGSAERGAPLYAKACASCHGAKGEGVGKMLPVAVFANQLKKGGAPPNVMLAFVNLSSRSGVPGMPTFTPAQLSDRDLADIAAHIWQMPMPAPPPDGAGPK